MTLRGQLDVLAVATAALLLAAGAFAYSHSGDRGDDVCARQGSSSEGFSLTHVAARCTGGLAADGSVMTFYERGWTFPILVAFAAAWAFVVVFVLVAVPRRRGRDTARG